MKLIFLGTGSMIPGPERNTSGMVVSHRNEHFLIDCGEGTQKQMRVAKFSPAKITRILITHWHGDHVFGLPGYLSTLTHVQFHPDHVIELYGPPGTKKHLAALFSSYVSLEKLPLKIYEVKEGIFFENEFLKVEAKRMDHVVPCYAYSFVEKDTRRINMEYLKKFGVTSSPLLKELQQGKSITINRKKISAKNATTLKKGKKLVVVFDTGVCKQAIALAKNSDILICEATFESSLKKLAKQYKHLTSEDAATIAKKAKVKHLIMTHFSQRYYKDASLLLAEAKKVFPNVSLAHDFLVIDV